MQSRSKPYRPGAKAWANHCGAYGLPAGLAHGQVVTILRWHEFVGTVRDEQGKEWEMMMPQVDPGSEYLTRAGNWLPEEHPKTRAALARRLEELREIRKTCAEAVRSVFDDTIRQMQEVLAQHPENAPQAVPS